MVKPTQKRADPSVADPACAVQTPQNSYTGKHAGTQLWDRAATDKKSLMTADPLSVSDASGAKNAEGDLTANRVAKDPLKLLLILSVLGMLAGLAAAFLLVGGTAPDRVLALGLSFFAGGLAIWRLVAEDKRQEALIAAAKDDKIERLIARCEDLEDRAWELRESDERHASILSALGDIVIRRDHDSAVVYANMSAFQTFGETHAPVVGAPLSLPVAADGRSDQDAHAQRAGFGDLYLQTVNGPRWFSRLDVSVRDTTSDQPLTQTVLRDVTDRRMIEQELLAARLMAETSNEAKSRFLATVSHEIRTPLNGVLGMAALLRDTRLTKEQVAYIEALETSGETLLMLIDEVLDFSKVEAGKLDIQVEPTPLAPLVENVVELLAPKAHSKGLEIGVRLNPHLPETVTLDVSRVRQILFNLSGNGVKFTDRGGIAIEIDGKPNPDGGSHLHICVRDTGIGFDATEAERLFKEFEQVDHGPTRKFGGTGLGLAIARRLAQLMGGTIEAIPGVVSGARFQLVLPIPENLVPTENKYAGKSIVIVSTGQIEGQLMCGRLAQDGADVSLCTPGTSDLTGQLAQADLILVDNASVADSGGWLVTARLAGCTAPAVVLVTPPERDRLSRLREAGFAAYLIRPVRMDTLCQVTEGLLRDEGLEHDWDSGADSQNADALISRIIVPARPLRLLVAEDNDINRLLSEALLRKLGHEPTMVIDGEKAVEAAATGEFDAILMDLHMPGLDGIGAIQKIRARETRDNQPNVPILMVTADVMMDARERASVAGAAGYLTKPLSAEAIQDALAALPRQYAL